jgi:hypothetical protein
VSRRVQIIEADVAPARSTPTDTGVAFIATITERGNLDPAIPIRSMDDYLTYYGTAQSYGQGYNWLDVFFRRGGNQAYLAPVRGPGAASATLNLAGTSGTTLVVTARSAGDWANGSIGGLTVEVQNGPTGASTRILILRRNGVEIGRTLEATTQAGVITNSAALNIPGGVTVAAGGGTASLPTVVAATNLAGGNADRGSITQTQVDAALALFAKDLGPGQVVSPDWQTTAAHTSLEAHAAATNRFAVPDSVASSTYATLLALGTADKGSVNASRAALWAPWLTVAGISGGATRLVPTSALFCAAAATTDASEGANQAPAGEFGRAGTPLILGVDKTFTDTEAAALEAVGVNLAIVQNGEVRLDGNRTLVDPLGTDGEWKQIGNARYRMSLTARLDAAANPFAHRRITPDTIQALDTALTGVLLKDTDQLYPGSDDPGFIVDTGPSVNTPTKIAAGILSAAVGYRPAPGADLVQITITKVGVADTIG